MLRRFLFTAIIASSATLVFAGVGDGLWTNKVPEKDRQRQNPFDENSTAQAVGAKLYRQNCAQCHGSQGEGQDKRPSLHSDRVRKATPGELEWLLKNGNMKNGMPSWSRLPEQQRWQIVTYLKSLP
jgi:mono/diheme cytochrome c family protein